MNKSLALLTGTLLALAATPAFAAEKCSVPEAEWQPQAALQQKLEAQGWKIKVLKVEDGCYEAYATDEKGERVEAYFNPKTFEIVEMKKEG